MNKVELIGRLTREPETRGEGEKCVARYTLAVNRRFSKEETDFINIVSFGKAAEFAAKYLKKGTKIAVVGRIQTGSYTNKDGQKVYTVDVIAEETEFCESKSDSAPSSGSTASSGAQDEEFMSIPDDIKDDYPF